MRCVWSISHYRIAIFVKNWHYFRVPGYFPSLVRYHILVLHIWGGMAGKPYVQPVQWRIINSIVYITLFTYEMVFYKKLFLLSIHTIESLYFFFIMGFLHHKYPIQDESLLYFRCVSSFISVYCCSSYHISGGSYITNIKIGI